MNGERPDPALAAAIAEIDAHAAGEDWGQPARLYALVETAALVAREPALAALVGFDAASQEDPAVVSLTPVEQDELATGERLEDLLPAIAWPQEVTGVAVLAERWVLPPGAEVPGDPAAAEEYAAGHPGRQRARFVAGATRAGARYCALRLRAADREVVTGVDLVPELLDLLAASLEGDTRDE